MRVLIIAALATTLIGCAAKYGDMGFMGGVSDRQIGQQVWAIRGAGNAFTSLSDTENFVMLRAAEIGREQGYSHFVFLSEDSNVRSETRTTGGTTFNATTSCYGTFCNTYGSSSGPVTTTTYKPDSEARVLFITQDEYDAMSEADRRFVMSVDQVWADLSPEYVRQ
jgi:hypothetical protein